MHAVIDVEPASQHQLAAARNPNGYAAICLLPRYRAEPVTHA
jgi:hypothetical protein